MKNTKRILSLIIVMALLLTMMAVPAVAKDSNTNETDIIGSLYLSATPTTITVRGATSSYSFRIDDSTTWTTNATFSGLYPNTEHTVYAKLGSAPEITVGKITTKAADYVSNPNATTIDAAAPNVTSSMGITHNVNFQESLSLYYYIPVANLTGYSNVRLFIQRQYYESGATDCIYQDRIIDVASLPLDPKSSTKRYSYIYTNIAAAQITEMIYVTLYAEKDGVTYVSPLDAYSIEKYCYNNLAKSTVSSANKTMYASLLNYGAAAQIHFRRNTSHLANANMTAAQQAMANMNNYTDWTSYKDSTGSGPANITSNNVNFGNTTSLYYYVTFPSGYDMSKVTFEASYTSNVASIGTRKMVVPSSSFEWDASKSRYTITISGMATTDYGCKITAFVKDGSNIISNQKTYSIESYCVSKADPSSTSTAESLRNLVTALMRYSYASRDCFK